MQYQAKSIVPEKFWIVTRNGEKVGTLRYDNEYILTVNKKNLRAKDRSEFKNIVFNDQQLVPTEPKKEYDVYGFACKTKPYNDIYDLKRKLPIYTKTEKSVSFFCAGYYIINFELGWRPAFCPKLITIERYNYSGPFKTDIEMRTELSRVNNL